MKYLRGLIIQYFKQIWEEDNSVNIQGFQSDLQIVEVNTSDKMNSSTTCDE
jgi:hypothetical protein